MGAEVVHHHHVARGQGRHQELLDIGKEALAVDRPVDHARRGDAIVAQGRQEGQRLPLAARYLGHQPATARRPAMAPRHVGLGPSLVDEDQPFGINPTLILPPLRPPPGNVGAVLFGGVQGFF